MRKPADMTDGLSRRPPLQVLLIGAAQLVGVNTTIAVVLKEIADLTTPTSVLEV